MRAKSFAEGMLFPFLRDEHGLRAGLAEFKRCPPCGRNYDGDRCPPPCNTLFDPTTTWGVGVDWLFVEGVYLPVRRWRCPKCGNLFPQDHCREEQSIEINDEGEEEICYHVGHGQKHDYCPLDHTRHPKRGTEVWRRAEYVGTDPVPGGVPGHLLPPLLEGIAEGMRQAIVDLTGWKAVLVALLAGREPAPAGQWSQDELLKLAEALFRPGPDTPTSGELLSQLRDLGVPDAPTTDAAIRRFLGDLRRKAGISIVQSLAEREIDEETINEWLRSTHDLAAEWNEEGGYEDDESA